MPRHTKHTMRATLTLDDESEVSIYVSYSYWPGMAGTYYEPPEAANADWVEVVAEAGKACRTLTDAEQEAFEAWWADAGRDLACEQACEVAA
jgi:hypothetical protein